MMGNIKDDNDYLIQNTPIISGRTDKVFSE